MLVDNTGRDKNNGYKCLGEPYDNCQHPLLQENPPYNEPVSPQRTVIQFNSTYMELVDRWEFNRGRFAFFQGLALVLGLGGLCVGLYIIYNAFATNKVSFYTPLFLAVTLLILFMLRYAIKNIGKELFTYTHFPMRFNRKTGKVHVFGSDRSLQTYDWKDLKIHIQHNEFDNWEVRCCDVEKKTIVRAFSLPYVSRLGKYIENLEGHFDFVNLYMTAKTDADLARVAATVKNIFPIHQRKETLKESFERSLLVFYLPFFDFEDPQRVAKLDGFFIMWLPFWFGKFIWRRLAVMTSRIPQFPDEIIKTCNVDPNDTFDLNKNPPVAPTLPPRTLQQKVLVACLVVFSVLAALHVVALIINFYGATRLGDHPNALKILWDILLFRWV